MVAAALRFLAHCFKMTLPVSLSTSAGRERERERGSLSFLLSFLFFSPPPSPFLSSVAAPSFPSLSGLSLRLSPPLPSSFPPCVLGAGSSHVTATLELLGWGMGEKGGRRREGRAADR